QHHFLRTVLPQSVPFIERHLISGTKVCIACDSGSDTSVGVGVTALALFFREDGSFHPQDDGQSNLCEFRNLSRRGRQLMIYSTHG
ncbi:hypothetical protein EDD16DRAFT_1502888, partial [Pisolithus croceorrhizus]